MDANGTRFHLLLDRSDWGACSVEDLPGQPSLGDLWRGVPDGELLSRLGWDASRSELTLPAQMFEFPAARAHVPPVLASRRGADADAYGNFYWIDDDETRVLVKSSGSGNVTTWWSVASPSENPRDASSSLGRFGPCVSPPPPPTRLRGLVITVDHYLIVGVVEPAGVLMFDLHAGGAPRQLLWTPDFKPFDMASGVQGTWILDRDPARTTARLWLLDRQHNPVRLPPSTAGATPWAPSFQPLEPGSPVEMTICRPAPALSDDLALDLAAIRTPVAIETLPDGSAIILDDTGPGFAAVWHFSAGAGLQGPFSLDSIVGLIRAEERPSFTLISQDFAFNATAPTTGASRLGSLSVVAQNGEQVFAFAVIPGDGGVLRFEALPEYWPMRLYGGRGLVSTGGRVYYDSRGDWLPLVQQPVSRYDTERTILTPLDPRADPSNKAVRHALDGRDPDCVWHRLMLDACMPPETAVHIWSRAANTEAELARTQWQREPDPYRRAEGSELPFLGDDADPDRGTWELLFQRARGRYLQLRIGLQGNTRSSPRLRAVRAYYPRFSYLEHYLPAAYREDAPSASFLDRFLANLEGMYTTLEDRLEAVRALFDPAAAPAEDLAWLATWLGIVIDGNWDTARQRLLIAMAPELFRLRGTRLGLIRAIRLATDPCPSAALFEENLDDEAAPRPGRLPSSVRVVEQFRTRMAPGVVFGDPSQIQGPGVTTPTSTWTPQQGPEPLNAQFRAYLRQVYPSLDALNAAWGTSFADISHIALPPTRPTHAAAAADWSHFLAAELGFTYAPVVATDEPAYRDFLTRRYGSPERMSQAYGLTGSSRITDFRDVRLPAQLPTEQHQLRDWIQFVSILVPTARNAHRFTVLVPSVTGQVDADRGLLLDRVRRLVELEKPAHTVFDVKEYWALFRVGEARLGFDTLLDRAPRLRPAVLDASYLVQSYLAPPHPYSLVDRMVLGRDRLEDRRPL